MPFNVSINENQANVGGIGTQRPNYVHAASMNCSRGTRISGVTNSSRSCIDIAAYSLPTAFTFGNIHRNDLHGPGQINTSFSIFKNFTIYENLKFQLRGESFNLFNHPNPSNPNSSLPAFGSTIAPNAFGTITSAQNFGRILQLAGKINF